MKLAHLWVWWGLLIDFFISRWFFVTFLFQSQVDARTYVLLEKAHVGQCWNSNRLGLLIENWKKRLSYGETKLWLIFFVQSSQAQNVTRILKIFNSWRILKHLCASSWFLDIRTRQLMWFSLVGDSLKLGSLFWAGCFEGSVFYALHMLYNRDTKCIVRTSRWGLTSSDHVSNACGNDVGGWLT